MAQSNVISVKIYDGLNLVCENNTFTNAEVAKDSATRIIENQKQIMGDAMTSYAMVFDSRRMIYYID